MNKVQNRMTVSFKAISENESFARLVIAAFVMSKDPTLDIMNDLKTAISEAVTNCIIHGYEGRDEAGDIVMSAETDGTAVRVSIKDFGRGIQDINLARQPMYTGSEDPERSGMGFTVMEGFTDGLEVISEVDKGTEIIMYKKLT